MLPQYIVDWVKIAEGGLSDHPNDSGQLTNFGISTPLFNKVKKRYENLSSYKTVEEISFDDAIFIYEEAFWKPYSLMKYKFPYDLLLFDSYIQHRPRIVGKLFQRSLNEFFKLINKNIEPLVVDGIIGPKTYQTYQVLEVYSRIDSKLAFTYEMIHQRTSLYSRIVIVNKKNRVFLLGWINRLLNLSEFIKERL